MINYSLKLIYSEDKKGNKPNMLIMNLFLHYFMLSYKLDLIQINYFKINQS